MMAIGGGPITTLLTSPNVAAIGLSASRVYVTDGTVMRGFPKAGGAEALNFDAGAKVTAMYVAPGSPGAVIYRVQAQRAVESMGNGRFAVYHGALPGRTASSVSFDGRVLWTDCSSSGNNDCRVRKSQNGHDDGRQRRRCRLPLRPGRRACDVLGRPQQGQPVRPLIRGRAVTCAWRSSASRPGKRSPVGAFPSRRLILVPAWTTYAPWHFLNFLPEPHQQGSLRPTC
jgi:hypothetical protein